MKTVLMCHIEDELTVKGLSRWLASFSDLAGMVLIREPGSRTKQRIRAEVRRSGWLRFVFDVLPYRIYSKFFLTRLDRQWRAEKIEQLLQQHPEAENFGEPLVCTSPNQDSVKHYLERIAPDLMLVRCKSLLNKSIFSIPRLGSFILHPGICPEYRNSHGCFWALANGDFEKVGATLMMIDAGIDTGTIFGYFSYPYDVRRETPNVIQSRVVYDNLDVIRAKLIDIDNGIAKPILTGGRNSKMWGQPWLSEYLHIKRTARKG